MTYATVLALFMAGTTEAVQYRPFVDGRTPWYKTSPKAASIDFPHDYKVPDFGVDSDIKATQTHTAAAEQRLKHVMKASFKKPAPPPQDYFVPNFGEDSDVKSTKKNIADAESRLGHTMQASFAQPAGPPRDYFVPDFGADHDIKETQKHALAAEKRLGHTWQGKKADDPPRDYFVPNFGEDSEIKSTQKNIADAETRLNHKMKANFAQWNGPATDAFSSEHHRELLGTEIDMHLESDPICSSAGCTQYKHKKKPRGYDIDYPVPDFGVDTDILDNHASLELAEKMKGHVLEMGTERSKAKWHNPAKDVDYNFNPKLDADIVSTDQHLADAENRLNHHWELA
jgi:hypothetical protein